MSSDLDFRHMDETGAFDYELVGTGIKIRTGGIDLTGTQATAPGIPVAGTVAALATTVSGDITSTTGNLIMGATTLSETDLAKIDGITNGTGAANKALVCDANGSINMANNANMVVGSGAVSCNRAVLNGGGSTSGSAGVRQTVLNTTGSIADNVATAVCTFTVPNAQHSAYATITILGILGAGGAVGEGEAAGGVVYGVAITRTAGVDTAITVATADGSAMAAVSGAATVTVTAAASALTGASSASQTFTMDVTINSSAGSSTNHLAHTVIDLINDNTSGITVT